MAMRLGCCLLMLWLLVVLFSGLDCDFCLLFTLGVMLVV